jgi:hypothetical protein
MTDPRGLTDAINQTGDALKNVSGPLGDLTGLGTDALSSISNSLFGNGSGNDTEKGKQYVQQRTIGSGFGQAGSEDSFQQAATGQALKDYLTSQGFNNYLTKGGVQQSSNTLQDMAKEMGYRNNTQGANTQEGYYNPMFEQRAVEQAASTNGPLTREQIASMSTTSGNKALADSRQNLIDKNKYLTSDQEYNEILNKEQGLANKNIDTQASNRLNDLYSNSSAYQSALSRATLEDQLAGQRRGEMDLGLNQAQVRSNIPKYAQDYAKTSEFTNSEQGKQYQDYLNQLQEQSNKDIQSNIAKQVYGRSTGTNDQNATIAGASAPMTLEQILARMGRT